MTDFDPPAPRVVAGLSCTEVLHALPDFLSGDLSADVHTRVVEHLSGCDWCTRFGGQYAATVATLQQLEDPLPPDVADRLSTRLDEL